jgi:outer membrane receptor protein involved in Fe transport
VPAASLFRRTTSLSANPTTQGLSLRAIAPSGAGRALVTLDGAPLNDPFGGWVIWSQLPPEGVAGVDIVRGAGAGPYGAGALTGVAALRERSGGGLLDVSAGEQGALRGAASATRRVGGVALTASALYDRTDGYTPVRGAAAGAADTPLDMEAQGGSVRLDAPVGHVDVSLRAGMWREERGAGLVGARSTAEGSVLTLTAARTPDDGRTGWRVQAWRRGSDLANSSVAVSADRSTTTPANDQFATPAEGWGVNAALRGVRGALDWEIGADGRLAEGETQELFRYMAGAYTRDRVAGGETSVAGIYAEGAWTQGPWLVAGGLRVDGWRNTGGRRIERDTTTLAVTLDNRPEDRSGEVVSGRLGLRLALDDSWAVRGAA